MMLCTSVSCYRNSKCKISRDFNILKPLSLYLSQEGPGGAEGFHLQRHVFYMLSLCALNCWCTEKQQMMGTPAHMARLVHGVLRSLLSAPYVF